MSNVILAKHTSYIIPDYEMGKNTRIEEMLSVWNKTYFKTEYKGLSYDETTKELRIPRGIDANFVEKQFGMPIQMVYDADPYEAASYRLRKEPKNDIQRKSISFLIGEGEFGYTKKYSQLTLNLDTGDGKTYCAIAAMTFLKMKSIIITHSDNVKSQWVTSFKKMTDLDPAYMLDIKGSAMINKLMKMKKIPWKVFFINHSSLQSFGKTYGWDKVTELFKKLAIGTKVFDEAHWAMENLIKVDLYTNTKKTIYLTANFGRSGRVENAIFTNCFKNIAKYGIQTRDEKRRHIVCVIVKFNSNASLADRLEMKNKHGLDKNKYLDYQLSKPIFKDVCMYILNYIKEKEGKALLMFSKNDAIEKMYTHFASNGITKTMGIYNSVVPQEEKLRALDADIILSTPKSLGTGSDIPGLRFNVVTEPYRSAISANQWSGRLREYGEDLYTFHFEMVDTSIPETVSMLNARMPVFKNKCAKIITLNYKPA